MQTPEDRWVRIREASKIIGMSVSTLQRLRMSGKGPEFSRIDRNVLYRVSSIHEWMQGHASKK